MTLALSQNRQAQFAAGTTLSNGRRRNSGGSDGWLDSRQWRQVSSIVLRNSQLQCLDIACARPIPQTERPIAVMNLEVLRLASNFAQVYEQLTDFVLCHR